MGNSFWLRLAAKTMPEFIQKPFNYTFVDLNGQLVN